MKARNPLDENQAEAIKDAAEKDVAVEGEAEEEIRIGMILDPASRQN